MPGMTNNQIALDALNQAIVALNEIADASPGDQSVLIEAIADNIEAVRTEIETRSVAEVTAQNTNFADLVGTIGQLRLVCQSIQQVNQFNHFYPNTPSPASGGGDGIPAPQPFEEIPYPEIERGTRKCWIATTVTDQMILTLDKWHGIGQDSLEETGFKAVFGLYVAAMSITAADAPLIAAVFGLLDGTLVELVNATIAAAGGLDFSEITTVLTNRRDDVICAMLSASTANEARSDVVAILTEEAVSVANKTWFTIFLDNGVVGHLFYSLDPTLEGQYQAATDIDCSFCNESCDVFVHSANIIASDNGTTIRVTAAQTFIAQGDNAYYAFIFFSVQPGPVQCEQTFLVENISVPSGTVNPIGPVSWRLYTGLDGTFGDLWHSNTMPTDPIGGARSIVVKSNVVFDVQLDRTGE